MSTIKVLRKFTKITKSSSSGSTGFQLGSGAFPFAKLILNDKEEFNTHK